MMGEQTSDESLFYIPISSQYFLYRRLEISDFRLKDSNGSGVVNLCCFHTKFLQLSGLIKDRERKYMSIIWRNSGKQSRFFIPEYSDSRTKHQAVSTGKSGEAVASGVVASWLIGITASSQIKGKTLRILGKEQFLSSGSQSVSAQLIFIVGFDEPVFFKARD